MSTLSAESITTITVNYNSKDIPDTDIQQFKAQLQELGYTRVRGYRIPATGVGFELWMTIEFIGLAAVTGIIGNLTVHFFNKLGEKISSFINKAPHPFEPFITNIEISYDDIDIKIKYIDENILPKIPLLMKDIMNEIDNGGLKECRVNTIIMPMEFRDGHWDSFNIEASSEKHDYPFRFWDISSRNNGCFGVYDFINKKFIKPDDLNGDLR
jgi:hypothetical protein